MSVRGPRDEGGHRPAQTPVIPPSMVGPQIQPFRLSPMVGEARQPPAAPPPMEKGATVVRTGGRFFRYRTHYSWGVALMEKDRTSHMTRAGAERAARRFVRPARAPHDIIGRFGADLPDHEESE